MKARRYLSVSIAAFFLIALGVSQPWTWAGAPPPPEAEVSEPGSRPDDQAGDKRMADDEPSPVRPEPAGEEKTPEVAAGTDTEWPEDRRLVSGVPYEGFLQGVLVPMWGPAYPDEVILEAPSRRVKVERRVFRLPAPDPRMFATAYPEALIGRSVLPEPLDGMGRIEVASERRLSSGASAGHM